MEYSLPSALDACLAGNRERTVCVNGGGGFVMNMRKLETIRRLHPHVNYFVLCNRGYGAVNAAQTNLFQGHLVACEEFSGL